MTPNIFFSKEMPIGPTSEQMALFQEGVRKLFPQARPLDSPDQRSNSSHSFFLSQGEKVIWAEIASRPFSPQDLSDYLVKARSSEAIFPKALSALLIAPDFEGDVQELLGLVRIPIRCFRYDLGRTASEDVFRKGEQALWLREVIPGSVKISPPRILPSPAPVPSLWNRLSREELREFIQLEIDSLEDQTPHPQN